MVGRISPTAVALPLLLLPLLLTSPAILLARATAPYAVQHAEGEALIALKNALHNHRAFQGFITSGGPPGITGGPWGFVNWYGVPGFERVPCNPSTQWAWVGCNSAQRVISVNLDGGYMSFVNSSWTYGGADPLKGSIPWASLKPLAALVQFDCGIQRIGGGLAGVGSLPALQSLDVMFNLFSGPIPAEISQLASLSTLALTSNALIGPIPAAITTLAKLRTLALGANLLSGVFPDFISTLKLLQHLELHSNQLGGPLPTGWGSLTTLTGMALQQTSISGAIPTSWSTLVSLTHASFASCGLTGKYPAVLTALPNIQVLFLAGNSLYGSLSSNVFTPKMTQLDIRNNYFNGPLPTTPRSSINFQSSGNCFAKDAQDRSAAQCAAFYKKH